MKHEIMSLIEPIQDEKIKFKIDKTTYMTDIKTLFSEVELVACNKEQAKIVESLSRIQSRNGKVKPYIESIAVGIYSKRLQ
ncbi:hypothetical protein [Litchfieldia salsa]|nr:hypothetical protein [Litchfieldia salsa]